MWLLWILTLIRAKEKTKKGPWLLEMEEDFGQQKQKLF